MTEVSATPRSSTAQEPVSSTPTAARSGSRKPRRGAAPRRHPLLEQLAAWHPAVFGPVARPLKRGIFHDLMRLHPELSAPELKAALALHTRSTRYLRAVASGAPRLDLDGSFAEPTAPEHQIHALLECVRRATGREPEGDATAKLHRQLVEIIEASGRTTLEGWDELRGRSEAEQAALEAALAEVSQRAARDEALLRAFEASAATLADFADMYGLTLDEAGTTISRARQRRQQRTANADRAPHAAKAASMSRSSVSGASVGA